VKKQIINTSQYGQQVLAWYAYYIEGIQLLVKTDAIV